MFWGAHRADQTLWGDLPGAESEARALGFRSLRVVSVGRCVGGRSILSSVLVREPVRILFNS